MNIFQMEVDKAMNNKVTSRELSINLICPRFENSYIVDPSKSESLRKSIKENGLIQPINVIDIFDYMEANGYGPNPSGCDNTDEYLDRCIKFRNGLSEEEQERLNNSEEYIDLMENLEKHIHYIISSGHRRFYAYVSLLLGRPINNRTEWKEAYPEIRKVARSDSEWKKIPVIMIDSTDKEYAVYNDSNTTQRELTSFEIVVNTIDEMKKNGEWEKICKDTVSEVVDGLSDKAVYNLVQKLKKTDQYREELAEAENGNIEIKTVLKKLPVECVPKTEVVLNKKIADYIYENKQRTVNDKTVKSARRICDGLDRRFMQLIFDGVVSTKDARTLVTAIQPLSDEEKDDLIKQIRSGKYDFSKNDTRVSFLEKVRKTAKNKEISTLAKTSNKLISIEKDSLTDDDIKVLKAVIKQLKEYVA